MDEPRPLTPDATLDSQSRDSARSVAGAVAAVASVVASITQFLLICGSPHLRMFHASDAAPADGPFTRLDRLVFIVPALLAIVVGMAALRLRAPRGVTTLGILFGFAPLLLVSRIGFSK